MEVCIFNLCSKSTNREIFYFTKRPENMLVIRTQNIICRQKKVLIFLGLGTFLIWLSNIWPENTTEGEKWGNFVDARPQPANLRLCFTGGRTPYFGQQKPEKMMKNQRIAKVFTKIRVWSSYLGVSGFYSIIHLWFFDMISKLNFTRKL